LIVTEAILLIKSHLNMLLEATSTGQPG